MDCMKTSRYNERKEEIIIMKISMINGSPKVATSCSGLLLDQLQKDILKKTNSSSNNITLYRINRNPLSDIDIAEIIKSDIIVVAFPLYVDGIPSHMLAALYQLEKAFTNSSVSPETTFYGIINNGFSEGFQNQHAANMLKLFCQRAGISFGQVFATGAGEMIRSMIEANAPFGEGPLSFVKKDWESFVDCITRQESASSVFCSLKMPGWLFRAIGNHTFWKPTAKKNGISEKQMSRRLSYSPK